VSHASQLHGTDALVPAIARRERVRLAVWGIGIVLLVVVTASSTKSLYSTQESLDQVAAVTKGNAAAIAFNGPPIALDTIGGQVAFQLGSFALTMVGLMSLLMMSRLTRAEEESGRLEMVRAMPVGRHAPLAAGVLVLAAVNVLVGAISALALMGQDLPVAGSVAMGASFAALGMLFVGLTALTAQLTENSRVASGIAGAVLGAAYALRAIGDAGSGTLSWLSPIGLAQKARPYAGEQWWPLILCALIGGGLLWGAVAISNRRDFGAGLLPPRAGPAHAAPSLGSELGLAVRLQRATVLWWTVGVLSFALTCGSLASTIQEFVADNDTLAKYFAQSAGVSLTDSFLATSLLLLALLPAGAAVQMVLRARSEETTGRAEALLATPSTRYEWAGSHVAVAFAGSSAALVLGGFGLGASAAIVLRDGSQVGRLTAASLAYLPALWVILAISVAVLGLVPRATNAVWGVWGLCLVLAFFGTLVDFPAFVQWLSPFDHVPQVPATDPDTLSTVVLLVAAVALALVGAVGLRRRDIG
jgi:ABC-2 type transport system permease protein